MNVRTALEDCKTADDFWALYDIYSDEEIENSVWLVRLNDNLLDDEDVMSQICCAYHPRSFKYASERLKNDRSFVVRVLSVDGLQLEHVGCNLKSDKSIVFLAVFTDSYSLKYAADELKFDRDILICACRHKIFVNTPPMVVSDFVKNYLPTDFQLIDI
jgi:hypothetical protein